MGSLNSVTMNNPTARKLKGKGRNGDTEIAHVTPGEMVVPLSVQTPEVRSTLQRSFAERGVPMERYTVGTTDNSRNPDTNKEEYFSLGGLLKTAVKGVAGFATGGPAGAALAVGSDLLGGALSGDKGTGSVTTATGGQGIASSPLPAPVAADNARGPSMGLNGISFSPIGAGGGDDDTLRRLLTQYMSGNSSSRNPLTGHQEFADTTFNSGLTQAQNQAAKRAAGYTGGFTDANEFQTWARGNSDGYLKYLEAGKAASPTFTNPVDLDPITPGQQTFTKDVNKAIGGRVGWSGETGGGQLGSGLQGIDYLSLNPAKVSDYTKLRDLAQPEYAYSAKNDGIPTDFNANQYLINNPTVSADISAGKYASPLGHYYAVGKNLGYGYGAPSGGSAGGSNPVITDPMDNPPTATPTPTPAANPLANISMNTPVMSPVRIPRFRSRRGLGTRAAV